MLENSTINLLAEKKQKATCGGGVDKLQAQSSLGKKTARERINLFLDENSFEEIDQLATSPFLEEKFYTDGVICGFGKVNGRKVAVFFQDFSIKGGSLGFRHAQKICKIMDLAAKIGCPVIGVLDSGGARIDEGIHALAGFGEIFMRNSRFSGVVPQISVVLGPCAGGAVYSPALTDFIFTTEKISQLFITGPDVIRNVLHQEVTKDDLGGARVHAEKTGLVHFLTQSEEECFYKVKKLLSYLPDNYLSVTGLHDSYENFNDDLQQVINWDLLIPQNQNQSYDVKAVIEAISDRDTFLEVQADFAQNIVVGFVRIAGRVVGIVANQSLEKAGTLDIDASCKAARFIKTCNNFNIPIVSLVDVPGFLPGIEQEHNGIIRHGAKLIYAYAEATVPKITVILRKAFGGAYIVMGSKHLGSDFNFSLPMAQIAVLGAQGAVNILHKRKINSLQTAEEKFLMENELKEKYTEEFLNPYVAAEFGYIDAIIMPNEIRKKLISSLEIAEEKVEHLPKKKHGNIPL
ncbi:TPA: methylmalonyl-CoA carboxyltransferase [Candidatus Dependentiae bacterium]|nr:methylmalonyl-CoA carboxyltransferase [Candidatus Dependentiae bacterium]HBZ73524.1 methylmalonyl-CoA carboxyltransferase [Candidatus Dependentiae bacterium]